MFLFVLFLDFILSHLFLAENFISSLTVAKLVLDVVILHFLNSKTKLELCFQLQLLDLCMGSDVCCCIIK